MTQRSRALAFFGACSLTMLGACAQQVGDIDRTQPNKIEKSAFEGEWYFLQTVVDVNATATASFTGLQGPLERVRFDIREDYLVARRTYEDIIGSDTSNYGVAEGIDYDGGAPVAAWPIMMHLDVQRQYNPATGEVSNVIIENMFDRPWFDREYMRPNFGVNVVDSGVNPMYQTQWISNVSYLPNDQGPFANWSVERDEDGLVTYIDVVNEYVIQPDWIDCILTVGVPNWGSECGPERVKVRSSFVRITDENESDHIARELDDYEMNDFGFFRTHRCVMDRRYGCRDNTRVTLANTWSIWENDTDGNGNALPYAQRTPDPIAYYTNVEMPVDLIDESYEIAQEWNAAFRRTVAGAQGVSIETVPTMFYLCLNPGSEDPTVPAEFLANAVDERERNLLTAAYASSAEGYANGNCARAGEVKNIGDIRYSYMNWVNNHPSAPWLGYGPSAADPLSAELIHGAANVNGASVDSYAQYALDIARVINGELTPEDLGYGENITSYFADLRERVGNELYFGYENATFGDDDTATTGQSLVFSGLPTNNLAVRQVPELEIRRMNDRMARLRQTAADFAERPRLHEVAEIMREAPETFALRDEYQRDPFAPIRGTSIESRMITDEMRSGFGQIFEQGPAQVSGDELLEFISPARWNRSGGLARRMQDRYRTNLTRTIEMAADFDPYMLGFATEIAELQRSLEEQGFSGFDLQERLWRTVRGRVYRAVQEHEVGHTLGLRHNFEASRDAMNFHPQYWALRSRTFNPDCDGSQGYETFNPTGLVDGNVAPESCSAESGAEYAQRSAQVLTEIRNGVFDENTRYGGITQYQYASIMDYDAKPSTHWSGLGLYDYAAIAYGYGDLVEVFNNAPYRLRVDSQWDRNDNYQGSSFGRDSSRVTDMRDIDNYSFNRGGVPYGDDNVFTPLNTTSVLTDNSWEDYHYAVLPIMFWDDSTTLDTTDTALQYYDLIDLTNVGPMAPMYDRSLVPRSEFNPDTQVRVPYRFCSDEYESTSNVCKVFDLGADDMEVFDNIRNSFESYYVVDFFRRGRAAYGLWLYPVYARAISRYFNPSIQLYQYWVLDLFRGQNWYAEEFAGLNRYLAAIDAINFVASTLSTPTVGTYVYDETADMYMHESDFVDFRYDANDPLFSNITADQYLDVGVEDGGRFGASRFVRNEDLELNYYSFYQFEVISHFITKLAAIEALTQGSVSVLGADTISDNSAFWLPPYVLFENEMNRLFGAIITEDFRQIGWCVRDDNGSMVTEPIEPIRAATEDPVSACPVRGGTLLNPYRAGFGNRDFNIQIQAAVYAGAFFQATLDKSWLDNSAVYMWGRGETPDVFLPENQDPNFEYVIHEATTGLTYAAIRPVNFDQDDLSSQNTRVGAAIVDQMNSLGRVLATTCPFQFAGNDADTLVNCNMSPEQALDFRCGYYYADEDTRTLYASLECEGWDDESAAAHVELNGPISNDYYGVRNDLDSLIETTRFQMEVNMVYNGL